MKKVIQVTVCILLVLASLWIAGRYGWQLFGFSACQSAGIERVEVEEGQVHIRGFYPGSFPTGFLGYHAEQEGSTLYIGFRFSGLFGLFETGDFDITVPARGTVTQVVIKTRQNEYPVWPREDMSPPQEKDATENGIYVRLEREDVYSVGWYYENKSGGMINADNSALETGKYIHLDNGVFFTAANLERPVPVTLVFSGKDGEPLAQASLRFDPQSPVLTVTLTADARILINGLEAEIPAVPTAYEQILARYCTALAENWTGQQLVDAGMNFLIREVAPEAVGFTVEDLDADGRPELAIGTISGDAFYGKLIFVLYTVDEDGEPVQILSSMERDRYYYAGGNRFANLGSSAADSSYVTTLKIEGEGLVDMTYTTDPEDYVQMGLTPVMQ